jgi:ketosteroid isomerase-like protein
MSTAQLTKLDNKLNEMTRAGKILDALEAFYAEDAIFQEGNGDPRRGRDAQHAHLSAFFDTLRAFNGATLHAQGVGDGVTLTEWTFDMTGPDGPIVWNEILVRRWNADGKVVSERFYTAG